MGLCPPLAIEFHGGSHPALSLRKKNAYSLTQFPYWNIAPLRICSRWYVVPLWENIGKSCVGALKIRDGALLFNNMSIGTIEDRSAFNSSLASKMHNQRANQNCLIE